MARTGDVRVLPNGGAEWKIPDLDSPSMGKSLLFESPPFEFGGERWSLRVWPNGNQSSESVGHVDVALWRESFGPPILVQFSFALKGQKDTERLEMRPFVDDCWLHCIDRFISRKEYRRRKLELLISGCLTVVCTIEILSTVAGLKHLSQKYVDALSLLKRIVKEKNDITKERDAYKRDKEILLKEKLDLEVDLKATREKLGGANASGSSEVCHHDKILHDFKQLYLNRENCDVILKVKSQEFLAHKVILVARSPVFASTFRNDMKEKETGVVNIEDCDPSIFPDFLSFLYSNDVDSLSKENVFGLFTAADKYDITDLRRMCLEFIKENLSVEIFCETLTTALQHSETDLIRLTTDFFIRNVKNILVTVKWQSFAAENPTQSNELFIKLVASDRYLLS